MTAPDRYAVFGQPINHSKSPRIHALFAAQTGQNLSYTAQEVGPAEFDQTVTDFFAAGGKGLNCTVPLKELAFRLADRLTPRAQRAKAVNTLWRDAEHGLSGDNTDGLGLIADLTVNHGLALGGQRLLLLGAGGASRGVIAPLLEHQPAQLLIANRTVDKAAAIAAEFADLGAIAACGYPDLTGRQFDLIINATSASLGQKLPPLPSGLLAAGGACYDMAYAKLATPFVTWGQAQAARLSLDGIGMLVEQAAAAFEIWRGVRPDSRAVIALLNQERGGAAS